MALNTLANDDSEGSSTDYLASFGQGSSSSAVSRQVNQQNVQSSIIYSHERQGNPFFPSRHVTATNRIGEFLLGDSFVIRIQGFWGGKSRTSQKGKEAYARCTPLILASIPKGLYSVPFNKHSHREFHKNPSHEVRQDSSPQNSPSSSPQYDPLSL